MSDSATIKKLMMSFRETTNSFLKKNEQSNTVKFIKNSINKIDSIIKTLDKMLKKRNIDIGSMATKTKDKGKEYLEKGKTLFNEGKEKGFINTIKDKSESVKSKLTDIFKGENKTGISPPETNIEENSLKEIEKDDSKKTQFGGLVPLIRGISKTTNWLVTNALKSSVKVPGLLLSKKNKTEEELKETQNNKDKSDKKDEQRKSVFSKMFSSSIERANKRKKEVEDEKKAVLDSGKTKTKENSNGWVDKILLALGGVGSVIKSSIGWLGGHVVEGLAGALTGLVPKLSTSIARTTSKLVTSGVKGAFRLTGKAIKGVGKRALPHLARFAGLAGRAALTLATGPVGWAVAAATVVYGGYKLYKYLKRNDVSDDLYGKLTRLRLLMYGFNDVKKEYYSKIFDLEMLMKDHTKFTDNKVTVSALDTDTIDNILDIFKVTREETDKYNILNTWFVKRFMPAYKVFMQSLWSINNSIQLDNIDKLRQSDVFNLITRLNIPNLIYDINQIPTFDDPNTHVTKDEVDKLVIGITNQSRKNSSDTKSTEVDSKDKPRQISIEAKNKSATQNKFNPIESRPINNKTIDIKKEPMEADSPAPKETGGSAENINTKVSAKLNKASGEVYSGDMSLTGIRLTGALRKEKIYNLDPNVRELFTGMAKEYSTLTGKTIPVNEAFRSYEDQEALYKKMPDKAAKPGNSTHEYGLALDVDSNVADELDKLGLMRKYGFTRPIGGEKWHIEPIGVSLNPTLSKNDPNFRNKTILASPGNGGGGYGTLDNSKLKRRDTSYQLSLYNSTSESIIDPLKTANKELVPGSSIKQELSPRQELSAKQELSPRQELSVDNNIKPNVSNTSSYKSVNLNNSVLDSTTKPVPNVGSRTNSPSLDINTPVVTSNTNTDIGKFQNLDPVSAIKQAAKLTGMSEDTMIAYAKMESSLKGGDIKNKNSSATGLFQIVGSTWKDLVKRHGPKYGIPSTATPDNNYYNALMAMEYAKENLSSLKDYKSAGIDEPTAVYLAHHYGASGANKIIKTVSQNPNEPMMNAVSSDAYSSNKQAIGQHTVSSYIQTMSNKIAMNDNKGYGTTISGVSRENNPNRSINTITAANNPEIQKTAYKANQSPYKTINAMYQGSSQQPQPIAQQSSVINFNSMEGYMKDQVSLLGQIANILTSIDGKFDVDKLKNLPKDNTQTPINSIDKSIPSNSINLKRKTVSA